MHFTISTKALFTGSYWLNEVVVEIQEGIIITINKEGYNHLEAVPIIAPALIDLQIYGAAEKLFSEFPTATTIQSIYDYCLEGGTAFFQPTIATQTNEIIYQAIDAVRAYKNNGGKGCIGLHIEGPWINPAKKGAHKEALIHAPNIDEMKALLNYGAAEISMITLAPEICSEKIIELIQAADIVVSAGHSNADYHTATSFFDSGISVATHLFNAMSPFQHRAPGLVGALFNHQKAMSSLVADGNHVDFEAIQIAKKIMGDRLFCITDAVTTTKTGFYQHQLVEDKYECNAVLSGSALTQIKSIHNLVDKVGIDLGEAIRMCSLYPAMVMQKENITGKIQINEKANLIGLSADMALLKTWIS